MKKITPSVFDATSAYSRKDMPWRIDAIDESVAGKSSKSKSHWKLFHYLSGGGMKVFGRTIEQEQADVKRTRFLIAAGIMAIVWLLCWI